MSRRATRPPGALDLALERLRAHHLPYRWSERDLKVWEAACPACRGGGWDLRIRESRHGGPITMICHNGCADVHEALEREPVEPRILAAEARAVDALAAAEAARDVAARAVELAGATTAPQTRALQLVRAA